MRLALSIGVALSVLGGVAMLATHIDASISEEEYVRTEAPRVTLSDEYEEGIHTYTGSLVVPTRCTVVSAAGFLEGDEVRITVTVTEDSEPCLMLATEKEFTLEVEASEEVEASVYVGAAKAVIVEAL